MTIITQDWPSHRRLSGDGRVGATGRTSRPVLGARIMEKRPETVPPGDTESSTDWEGLDSRVSTAIHEIQAALEEALAATRDLIDWVERLRTVSAFVRQVESGLVEVRGQLERRSPRGRRPVMVPSAKPEAEPLKPEKPWAFEPAYAEPEVAEEPLLDAVETPEAARGPEPSEAAAVPEPEQPAGMAEGEPLAEGEPPEGTPKAAEVGGSVRLEIESSEANVDLMLVERALRETPGVADVDLLDYAGKRAGVRVVLSEGERSEETADPARLAAEVQQRLAKLTWDGGMSVSAVE